MSTSKIVNARYATKCWMQQNHQEIKPMDPKKIKALRRRPQPMTKSRMTHAYDPLWRSILPHQHDLNSRCEVCVHPFSHCQIGKFETLARRDFHLSSFASACHDHTNPCTHIHNVVFPCLLHVHALLGPNGPLCDNVTIKQVRSTQRYIITHVITISSS